MDRLFTGSGVALVTPFLDGEVDWAALEQLVDLQLAGGTDALVPCGTTGEPSTLSSDEHDAVVKFVVERVAGRVPVIAGAGSNSTAAAATKAKKMQDLGADGVLIVTPYYNKCTQNGLRQHFEAVADAVQVPVIMYNVPSRTGVNLAPHTAEQLSEHPNIWGLKEACGDLGQVQELFRRCRGKLPIYSGNDDQVYALLALGGDGVISVAANVAPKRMHELVQSYRDGQHEQALQLQEELAGLIDQLFTEVNPIPVKAALSMMGLIRDELRLPLTELSAKHRPSLKWELENLGLA
ncbi:4-hydroxy-tetrahydrodipicolinate synthase [Actinomyces sp. F1_1611]